MSERFFISDTHFGDQSMYTFTKSNGECLRPWADNADDGDWYMIKKWNQRVGKNDLVYHCGDIAMKKAGLKMLDYLNGLHVLIKGNHDRFQLNLYRKYFKDIRGCCKIDDFIVSHIPLHTASVPKWALCNVHGHIHGEDVQVKGMLGEHKDSRYFNVSVESLDCVPISFDEIKEYYN